MHNSLGSDTFHYVSICTAARKDNFDHHGTFSCFVPGTIETVSLQPKFANRFFPVQLVPTIIVIIRVHISILGLPVSGPKVRSP